MIVSECFPNDSLRIARIQSSFYWSALSIILTEAKDRYRTAAVIVGVKTELLKRVNSEGLKDHRPLQWLHDAFAAKFRYEYVHEPDLIMQINSFENQADQIEKLWFIFLRKECTRFFDCWPYASRLICVAVFFRNPDVSGIAAEDELYNLTLQEYPFLERY
jgi:hypothetical protein